MAVRFAISMALSALLWTAPAHAQQAVVRSGEHDGFTRLVVDLPVRVDWAISGEGARREVSLQDFKGSLDLSQVYDRLSAGRIVRVEALPNGAGLGLDMNCDCDVALFWLGPGMLVVDIRGEITLSEPDSEHSSRDGAETSFDPPSFPTANSGRAADALAEAELTPLLDVAPEATDKPAPNVEAARASIARDISAAASMGLLSVATGELAHETGAAKALVSEPEGTLAMPLNFSTQNAAEVIPPFGKNVQTAGGVSCLADALIDLPSWGDDAPFGRQLAEARAGLMGEFDRLSPEAALRTARLYLYFGLGMEAVQMINFAGLDGDAAELVRIMAEILEEEPRPGELFAGQIGCETAAALWAALGRPSGLRERPNVDAMLKTLSAYPVHLRDLLGPRLAGVLTAQGRPKDAARVLRLIERGQTPANGARMMAQARTEAALGKTGPAAETLSDVMAESSQFSVEAAIESLWMSLEAGLPIEPGLTDLLEGHAREQRGTDIGNRLLNAHIVALAAAGRHDEAVDTLFAFEEGKTEVLEDRTFSTVAEELAKSASDITFLKNTLGRGAADWERVSSEAAQALAARLKELGFADAAAPYVEASRILGSQSQDQLLVADAELGASQPENALTALTGLSGAQADLRRAQAFAMMGDHRAAHRAYTSAGRPADAEREALLFESSVKEDAAPAAAQTLEADALPGQLERSAALIEQSEDTRAEIGKMLGTIGQIPDYESQ